MNLSKSLLIPLGVFFLLVGFLALGFRLQDPHLLPSALIDKPFPEFALRDLHQPETIRNKQDVMGEVSLVNVWGTWCPNCIVEHPELMRISREENIRIIGINYNDEDAKAITWLERRQDPYQFNIVDDEGKLGIDLGVYGAPETFVVDAQGVIRFRHVGPVNTVIWEEQLLPVVEHLRSLPNAS